MHDAGIYKSWIYLGKNDFQHLSEMRYFWILTIAQYNQNNALKDKNVVRNGCDNIDPF